MLQPNITNPIFVLTAIGGLIGSVLLVAFFFPLPPWVVSLVVYGIPAAIAIVALWFANRYSVLYEKIVLAAVQICAERRDVQSVVQDINTEDSASLNYFYEVQLFRDIQQLSHSVFSFKITSDSNSTYFVGGVEIHTNLFAARKNLRTHNSTSTYVYLPQYKTEKNIYIVGEHDRYEQGDSSLLTTLFGSSMTKETKLEWNDFENTFRIMTDDGSFARRLLTPDFMQVLYDWCTQNDRRIAVAITKQGTMVLLENEIIYDKRYALESMSTSTARFVEFLESQFVLQDLISNELQKKRLLLP